MPAGEVSLGLIGVGRWGRKIARTLGTLPGIRLAAAASNNPDTAGFLPAGCRIHADWRNVVAADDLQGVIIASPADTHAQMLLTAVEAGKAVLVEKPLCTSRHEVSELRARTDGRNITVLVDHIHLFHPAFQALQREAASLGRLRSIASAAGKLDDTRRGISLLWDWAPHDLAMCMALAPGLSHVTGATWLDSNADPARNGETLAFSLELAGNAEARVELSTAKPRHRWFAATFDDGVLAYRDTETVSLVRLRRADDIQAPGMPISFDQEPPLRAAIARFAQAIRQQDRARSSFELGLSVVNLIADIEDRLARPDH
jgi:predicted dehydrogenase